MQINQNYTNLISRQHNTLTPMKQRAYLGVTGIILLPAIDMLNPYVDDDTKKFSAIRSGIYQFISMASGILTRYVTESYADKLFDKHQNYFLSKDYITKALKSEGIREEFKGVLKNDEFRTKIAKSATINKYLGKEIDFSKIDDWFKNPEVKDTVKQALTKPLKSKMVFACGLIGGILSVIIIDYPFITRALNFVNDKLKKHELHNKNDSKEKKVSINA